MDFAERFDDRVAQPLRGIDSPIGGFSGRIAVERAALDGGGECRRGAPIVYRGLGAVGPAQIHRNSQRYADGSRVRTSKPLFPGTSNTVPAGYVRQASPIFASSSPLTTVIRSGASVPKWYSPGSITPTVIRRPSRS